MNRRGFLKSILAAGVAPAFVGSSVLMPLTKILSADGVSFVQSGTGFTQLAYAAILHGDGISDDTAAMQAFVDGLPVLYNGQVVQDRVGYGRFLITREIQIRESNHTLIHDSHIIGKVPQGQCVFRIHADSVVGAPEPFGRGLSKLRDIYVTT